MRRAFAIAATSVIARLDRAIEYSRDTSDRAEKPRRYWTPPIVGDDAENVARSFRVIASEAKQSIEAQKENGLLRRKSSSQ